MKPDVHITGPGIYYGLRSRIRRANPSYNTCHVAPTESGTSLEQSDDVSDCYGNPASCHTYTATPFFNLLCSVPRLSLVHVCRAPSSSFCNVHVAPHYRYRPFFIILLSLLFTHLISYYNLLLSFSLRCVRFVFILAVCYYQLCPFAKAGCYSSLTFLENSISR